MIIAQIFLAAILTIIHKTNSQLFQLTSLATSISSNFTLVAAVSYDLNFSMTSPTITAGSTVGLKFSERFNINSTNLANCRAAINSATSPVTAPCSVAFYSGASIY